MSAGSLSLVLAGLAVAISVVALWRNQFVPFRPVFVVGSTSLRIYPIRSEDRRWFIASALVPISITNSGARPGTIQDFRLVAEYQDGKGVLLPVWEADPVVYRQLARNRFRFLKHGTNVWMPFVVLPGTTVVKHLLFETRWDRPVIQDVIPLHLDVISNTNTSWLSIGSWDLRLGLDRWRLLVDDASAFILSERTEVVRKEASRDSWVDPPYLEGEMPEDWLPPADSWLDYPESAG